MKIAVLDDYLRRSQHAADWSKIAKTCDITVFDRPLAVPDEAAAVLALMKPSAILVNTARGAIIDEARLVEALERCQIAGAGLDVFTQEPLPDTSPLRRLPNVVLTPHQGHHVEEFYRVAFADVVENITAFLAGSPIRILAPERNLSGIYHNA